MSAPEESPLVDPEDRSDKRHLDDLPAAPDAKRTDKTEIAWTHAQGYVGCSWNPVTGCVLISPGCRNCYSRAFSERFRGVIQPNGKPNAYYNGFDPTLRPERLNEPRSWRKARMVFVNSMSDLFGEFVPDEYLDQIFSVMRETPQHIYQILTKRADRVLQYTTRNPWLADAKHIWLGVSVEDQRYGLPRVELLRQATAAVRFLSVEPLLEKLGTIDLSRIDWVIVGGESGPSARAMQPAWAREVRDQCIGAKVPFFFKQWGEFDAQGARKHKKHAGRALDGRTWDEFPCGLVAGSVKAPQQDGPASEPAPHDHDEPEESEQNAPDVEAERHSAEEKPDGFASYDAKPTEQSSAPSTPTQDQYEKFQLLHRYFNEHLGLNVQPAMLAFSRKAKAFGYFAPERWRKDTEEVGSVSEIALNPDCLSHEPREVAATIVHEMLHQWQHEHGEKKSRRAYHNKEWASKMEAIGLMPSSTGEPGGKKTGAKMSDYVIDGGAFAQAFSNLPPGALLPFVSGSPTLKGEPLPPKPPKPKDPSKTPFICPGGCKAKMWGKPSLRAVCKACGMDFVPATGAKDEPSRDEPSDV